MAWPSTAVVTGELITAAQLNALPVRIADTTLGAAAASIDLESIPNVYKHLLLAVHLRGVDGTINNARVRFNDDSGSAYDYQRLSSNTAAAAGAETFADTGVQVVYLPGAGAGTGLYSAASVFIPNYAGTAYNKTLVAQGATKYGTVSARMYLTHFAGFWRSPAAINKVSVYAVTGNLDEGSAATLYGLP